MAALLAAICGLSFDDLTKRFGAEKATAFYQEAKAGPG
jgi:hypothetical protein